MWGFTITLHDARFRKTIRSDQISITEDKHHSDLQKLMKWEVLAGQRQLRIMFKQGNGDFGTGNTVLVSIDHSALIGYTGANNRIE